MIKAIFLTVLFLSGVSSFAQMAKSGVFIKNKGYIVDGKQVMDIKDPFKSPVCKARINIDSTDIHMPNSFVRVNADSCTGSILSHQWLQVNGPSKAIFTSVPGTAMYISGLFPGTYRFMLFINDDYGNVDSAFVNVAVHTK